MNTVHLVHRITAFDSDILCSDTDTVILFEDAVWSSKDFPKALIHRTSAERRGMSDHRNHIDDLSVMEKICSFEKVMSWT